MSSALEERISEHLHESIGVAGHELATPPPIAAVRRIAKRRMLRTRAAVGIAGLVAIVGMASFIPTATEPNALITADEATTDESAQQDGSQEEPSQQITTRRTNELAAPPPSWRVVGDGSGGFVAIGATASTGQASFVRSDNGVDWYHAGSWEPDDDLVISELRQVDGSFVAILDIDRPAGTLTSGLRQPGIAISQDLIDWTTIDLDLTPLHDTSRFAVVDMAMHGAEVMLSLAEFQDPIADFAGPIDRRDICTYSTTAAAVTITTCSGERTVHELSEPSLYVTTAVRVLKSSDGELAVELPVGRGVGGAVGYDIFAFEDTVRFSELRGERVDPIIQDALDTAGLTSDSIDLLSITNDQQGQLMVLLRVREGAQLLTLHLPSGVVSQIPAELQAAVDVTARLTSGPSGWAMQLRPSQAYREGTKLNGWNVFGIPGVGVLNVIDQSRSEGHFFLSPRIAPAPDVQWSLFGATRYYRSGTNEVLVEVAAEDTLQSYDAQHSHRTEVPDPEAFTESLNVDGWVLSGNPVRGPLMLTTPDGDVRTFEDGFAFTNGDVTDGVEMDLYTNTASPFHLLAPHGPIQFFDSTGAIEVEFETTLVHQSLVLPAMGMPDGSGATDTGAQTVVPQVISVLHSPDGAGWQVVGEVPASSRMETEIYMGDEEILVTRRNVPGVVRLALTDTDE